MDNIKKNKAKKIAGIVLNVVLWLFVAFALVVTVVAVSSTANKKNVPTIGGTCYMSVLSDSMNADKPAWATDSYDGFKQGDLIFCDYIAENEEAIRSLKVGDIISFEWDINGNGEKEPGEINTHRIIGFITDQNPVIQNEVPENETLRSVVTQGDNIEYTNGNTETVSTAFILAKYTGRKIGGLGAVFKFLGSKLGFGLCILLPLAIFFAYELVVFILTLVKVKNEGKKTITAEDEELIKQRAIEEYLKMKQAEQGNPDSGESSASE